MQFSTLLLPILGGVIFYRATTRFRYRLYRRKGYELFFLAATAGAILLGRSFLLTQLVLSFDWGIRCYTIWNAFSPEVPYLGTSILAFALGWTGHLWEWSDVYFNSKRTIVLQEVDEFGTEIELLLFRAVEDFEVTVQLSSISYISPFDPNIDRPGWPMEGQDVDASSFTKYYPG